VSYVGRFAPSPTGPLHIGSLTAAVASFLHARQNGGSWLLRIENIDPPREARGAVDRILAALEAFDLHWDSEPLFQSTRIDDYERLALDLLERGLAYRCSCSRRDIRKQSKPGPLGFRYPGTCRNRRRHRGVTAIRARADGARGSFEDGLQGTCRYDVSATTGDYVIFRSDGLPAYHLAVVADDAWQGVTHVVRGVDLLELTGLQIHLQGLLGLPTPAYLHFPVVVNANGQKLSKQTGARAVDPAAAAETAREILHYLGLEVPREMCGARPAELWTWAAPRWRITSLRGRRATLHQADRAGSAKMN
jgi:glutamyl-Q tRNA(Asp) synthetase